MKRSIILTFMLLFLFLFVPFAIVMADEDEEVEYESYNEEGWQEAMEEGGEAIGWAAIILYGSAGLLFPMKRSAPYLLKTIPEWKNTTVKWTRMLTKHHQLIGMGTFLFASIHGIIMLGAEGELRVREYLGIIAVAVMGVGAFSGLILSKKKPNKAMKTFHLFLISFAGILVALHLAFS